MGLFGPSAMGLSVERPQRRIDSDGLLQHALEGAARGRALEALQPSARVDAPPREPRAGRENAVPRHEADQLRLRRLPPAAGAGPDGCAHWTGWESSWEARVSDACAA